MEGGERATPLPRACAASLMVITKNRVLIVLNTPQTSHGLSVSREQSLVVIKQPLPKPTARQGRALGRSKLIGYFNGRRRRRQHRTALTRRVHQPPTST